MQSPHLKKGLPVEIHMETTHSQDGEVNHHQFEETGRLVEMNGCYYIRYEETHEEGNIPVTVKMEADGVVTVIRRGELTTRLRFDVDRPTGTQYRTPVGNLPIRIETGDVRISYYDQPFSGRVQVDYTLNLGDQQLGAYHLRLRFTT